MDYRETRTKRRIIIVIVALVNYAVLQGFSVQIKKSMSRASNHVADTSRITSLVIWSASQSWDDGEFITRQRLLTSHWHPSR